MKKELLAIIFVGFLVLSGLGAVAISESKDETCKTETILFSQPILSEKEDYIVVDVPESTSNSIEARKPALPVVTKLYTFPFGTHVTNVEVSYSTIKEKHLSKPVMPAPEPQIVSTEYTSSNFIEKDVAEMYADIDIYPENWYSYRVGAGLKDGQHTIFLTVHLHPVQYTPKSNMIYYSDSATIDITYTSPENPVSFPDEYDLLIITPAEFIEELQPLVDHKNQYEIPTIMKTLDEIPSQGVDEQESIKYYIKDAIENWGVTYVLLVGSGVEDDEKFPVRYAPSLLEEKFPSDLYYADIYDGAGGFSTWDDDGDGRYAEYPTDLPAVDIYPDVYLSRLPCNNAGEVTTIVDKIINYKEHNMMVNKILQIGGDTHPGDADGIYEGEFTNEEVLTKLPGYNTTRLWGSHGNLTKLNIRNGFMGNVDFVDFIGHGYPNCFITSPPNDPNTFIPPKSPISPYPGFLSIDYDLFLFNNAKKLPVVVYHACSCSKFTESPDCMGWKPLSKSNGGAIASFGASALASSPSGSHATERQWGWMDVHIFEEMYNNKILGLCWGNCITNYIDSLELYESDYDTLLAFTLFGDPTLAIEDGEDPESISVDVPSPFLLFIERIINRFPLLEGLFSLLLQLYNTFHYGR